MENKGEIMLETIALKVEGMSCNHCVNAIEGNVGKLEGIDEIKVNLSHGIVDVKYNPSTISLDQIKEAVEDQGYDVI
jgi:copper chaperone